MASHRFSAALAALLLAGGAAPVAFAAPVPRPAPGAAEVPSPSAGTSVVTVRTGADREGDADVTPLAGVRLGLYATEEAGEPLGAAWATCTSDAEGDCSFTVPDTGAGGDNEGSRFWVRQLPDGVPAGWYTNPSLRTGKGSGSGSEESAYQFRTPALEGGRTYTSTADFMRSTDWAATPYLASTGTWQQSRVNPPLPAACGLDVAVVLDLSSSVGSALPQLKAATDKLTDTLTGTPSRLALFSFDRNSPSAGTANHPDLVPVSTEAGAEEFKELYAGWGLGSGTNWDQGLNAVAQADPTYDLVVVLTDGNPTRFSKPYQGDGSNTHFADVEGGVFAANAVKARGERVVAVGVGKGVEGVSGLNLRAISGQTAYDPQAPDPEAADHYQTTDFAAAGEALRNMALTHCDGTLSVIKQIAPEGEGEDVTGAEPAGAGWQFDASTTTAGVGGLPDTRTTTDDGTGGVVFHPTFPTGVDGAAVTVAETQQDGYELVTRDGRNAVCTDLDDGTPVAVTNTGTEAAPGFTVQVPKLSAVSCVLYNRPVTEPSPTPTPTEPTPTPTEPTPTPTEPTPTPTEPTPTPTEPTPTPTEPTPTPTEPTPTPTEPTPTPTDPTPTPTEPTPTPTEPTPTPTEPTPAPTPTTSVPPGTGGPGGELPETGASREVWTAALALLLTGAGAVTTWRMRHRRRG
ncbi:vWA domain-containing protein [Streptomyces filamentosus]|uniref:vWA domain-containing protein n=1 Tax=Streptomyces filamentosus TaxID=67294 RepID=UPI0037D04F35